MFFKHSQFFLNHGINILLTSFPRYRVWAEKKEPAAHCLRMLSSPRISGNLEKVCFIILTSVFHVNFSYKSLGTRLTFCVLVIMLVHVFVLLLAAAGWAPLASILGCHCHDMAEPVCRLGGLHECWD